MNRRIQPVTGPSLSQSCRQSVRKVSARLRFTEHSIKSVLSVAERAYVLSRGTIVFEGTADSLGSDELERVFLREATK